MGGAHSSTSAIARRPVDQRRNPGSDLVTALRAVLDQLDFGVMLIDRASCVLYSNERAHALVAGDAHLTVRRRTLFLGDEPAHRAIESRPRTSSAGSRLHAREVSRPAAHGPRCALLSAPGLRQSGDLAVVFIYGCYAGRHANPAIMQQLYGLTPAEAQTAAGILDGHTPAEIAERLRVSINTVRSHVKRVFQKCEVRSQVQLVRLLGAGPCMSSPPEP